jgi:exodeoxyribonuclease-3
LLTVVFGLITAYQLLSSRLAYRTTSWDKDMVAYVAPKAFLRTSHAYSFLKSLEKRGKPVIWTGDLNCAHQEIDLAKPDGNVWSGFLLQCS